MLLFLAGANAAALGAQEPSDLERSIKVGADTSRHAVHEDLAKQLQNPFANLITFPLQNITSLGVGPSDGEQNVLNLQPVVPIHLSPDWNLLSRPILPIAYTSVPESEFGLGDLNLEPFLSPRKGGHLVWGAGLVLGVPTATSDLLGTGKWTAGPSIALFGLWGSWALSAIINQQWSYAGKASRDDVSLFQLQPSLSYMLGHGWVLVSGPLIAADWTAASGQVWTVPLGAGVGRLFTVGRQRMNLQLEGYANVIRPDDGAQSMILLTFTLLFVR
jgi:hypothetical protein